MTDTAISLRRSYGLSALPLSHYSLAAITAAADKWHWVAPFDGRIVDIICNSEAAGSGAGSDIVDVNINGTTIYTTQANRPTLATGDTGMFTEAGVGPDAALTFVTGDIISYDVDAVCAGAGSTKFSITVLVQRR